MSHSCVVKKSSMWSHVWSCLVTVGCARLDSDIFSASALASCVVCSAVHGPVTISLDTAVVASTDRFPDEAIWLHSARTCDARRASRSTPAADWALTKWTRCLTLAMSASATSPWEAGDAITTRSSLIDKTGGVHCRQYSLT
eukprot:8856429-Pyramimonas_sp.AAC.1